MGDESDQKGGGATARERRLAEALRANLKRRKEQARERRAGPARPHTVGNEDA